MLIDWFTVAAQAVNFLILVWLLKRFLYGPIIEAMQTRRERLAGELARAREARQEADRRAEDLSNRQEELEREVEALLNHARIEANEHRDAWLEEAQAEVDARSKLWEEAAERERVALADLLKVRMAGQVVRVSEKVLRDLAGDSLEARAVSDFIKRLSSNGVVEEAVGRVTVKTGFPLSESAFSNLSPAIKEIFPNSGGIKTDEDASIGFGIVMVVGDNKWEWSLASYLNEVEEAVFADLLGLKGGDMSKGFLEETIDQAMESVERGTDAVTVDLEPEEIGHITSVVQGVAQAEGMVVCSCGRVVDRGRLHSGNGVGYFAGWRWHSSFGTQRRFGCRG